MGIPSYFSYIVKNHAQLIHKIGDIAIQIDNLYLDCNSIIYDAVHNIDFAKLMENDIDAIIKEVVKTIDEYIALLKPTNNIFIAFDGVAPMAKLEQQRNRRYKSLYQNTISKSIFKDGKPDPWNTTAITPGTVFMKRLGDKVKSVYSNNSKYGVQHLIISTSDSCGEGEHKLFEYIRTFPEQHQGKNTIIYGLDADLIMLSINHLPVTEKIYLFRETPHFIKNIQPDLDPNESYIIDIPELARAISSEMKNDTKKKGEPEEEQKERQNANSVYDYIFMCFFLGNDFMPHFPAVNIRTGGVDKMINMYKATIGKTSKNLTDGKTIFWGNVRELVSALAEKEEEFLQSEAKLRDRREKHKINPSTPEEKFQQFESLPTYDRPLEKYINPFKSNWRLRYYKCLFKNDITEENIQEICMNYLEGLEWTMKYYTQGCADWRWCYNYHYPPLLCDLLRYIPLFEREFITNKQPNPVSELVQLCYVLPLQSLHLLPGKLYDNLIREHIGWYKNDCKFVWAYCRYFWEAHVVMPEIDINELEAFVQKNSG